MKIDIGDGIKLTCLLNVEIARRLEDRKYFEGFNPEDPICDVPAAHTYGEIVSWIDDDISEYRKVVSAINAESRAQARQSAKATL